MASSLSAILDDCEPALVAVDPASRKVSALIQEGEIVVSDSPPSRHSQLIRAFLPGLYPEDLGDAEFRRTHGLRYAYVGGAMARGIGSAELVIELAKMGGLGFFGAAGLGVDEIESAMVRIGGELNGKQLPWGSNLIHSPAAPGLEEKVVELYLKHGVTRVSASAFMAMAPSIVRYAASGLTCDESGRIRRRNHVFAKISRPEVARHFLNPAPPFMLEQLLEAGQLTREEADLAAKVPVASAITVESDSGGHTDNRPLGGLFSRVLSERETIASQFAPAAEIPIGAAGGLGTPESLASAFALGAAYVLIGSVHQATVEAGISADARDMLARADVADVGMTASADMFEGGVKVQVLTLGTMMAHRGNQLYRLYQTCDSLDAIPESDREDLERNVFRMPLDDVWKETRERAARRDPAKVERAEADPRFKMAMVFRSYLGRSSRWPLSGEADRSIDYQIWCGPAMGAFNKWVVGSFLEEPKNRTLQQVALNLLNGASRHTRIHQLQTLGVTIPKNLLACQPRRLKSS